MAKTVRDYRYHIYVDRGNENMELAAWYDVKEKADKEARFLRRKGYQVEVRENKEASV